MRLTRTITQGTHPDTPPQGDVRAIQHRLWAIYVDGQVTFWFADRHEARRAQKVALDSGRYEYVDLVLEEDRRTDQRRNPRSPGTGCIDDRVSLERRTVAR